MTESAHSVNCDIKAENAFITHEDMSGIHRLPGSRQARRAHSAAPARARVTSGESEVEGVVGLAVARRRRLGGPPRACIGPGIASRVRVFYGPAPPPPTGSAPRRAHSRRIASSAMLSLSVPCPLPRGCLSLLLMAALPSPLPHGWALERAQGDAQAGGREDGPGLPPPAHTHARTQVHTHARAHTPIYLGSRSISACARACVCVRPSV